MKRYAEMIGKDFDLLGLFPLFGTTLLLVFVSDDRVIGDSIGEELSALIFAQNGIAGFVDGFPGFEAIGI